MNTGASHGSALGAEEIGKIKTLLGFNPDESFEVETPSSSTPGSRWTAARPRRPSGRRVSMPGRRPTRTTKRCSTGCARELPAGWTEALPSWPVDPKGVSTRAASGAMLNALAPVLPELWGGSADLAESNNTTMKGADSFGPAAAKTGHWNATPYGRTLHFGIREHAMGAILSGIVLHGPTRAYGGTFLQFSDYMRGAVRLAAVMGAPAIYVWTHDSIGLGEDGPTHQPVEHLAALRAIPGLAIVRPADGNETAYAWQATLDKQSEFSSGPVGLALTRQNVPTLEGTTAEGVARGAYVLNEADGELQVIFWPPGPRCSSPWRPGSCCRPRGSVPGSCPCRAWTGSRCRTRRTSSPCCRPR